MVCGEICKLKVKVFVLSGGMLNVEGFDWEVYK